MTTLQNVLENVHNLTESNASEIFEDIAKQLFRGFCIKQGSVEYRFLEVEFYYFSPEHKDVLEFGNRPFVYARNCKVPGTFFVHASGLDICFTGRVDSATEDSRGGGILIRSLLRIDEEGLRTVVTGPWDCMDALINYTNESNFPRIVKLENIDNDVCVQSAGRCNDRSIFKEKKYCFYDFRYVDCKNDYWSEQIGKLNRYDPITKGIKKEYSEKPWNRKNRV